jgi:spore maturation protein CgeB
MRDEFSFETLDYLKKKYTTINWFCDDHWRFESFTKKYAPHLTYSVSTDKYTKKKYIQNGLSNVIMSQWASFGHADKVNFEGIEYKYNVSFIGGTNGYRRWIIKELGKRGINVECFGSGWKNGRLSFEKIPEVFRTSKINLNMSNSAYYDIRYLVSVSNLIEFIRTKKKVEQIKARNFEIPCFGGFQLTNYVPGIEEYFAIGKEIAAYSSIEDLAMQIEYYLDNTEERKKITVNGYNRAIKDNRYTNRLKEVFREMEARE